MGGMLLLTCKASNTPSVAKGPNILDPPGPDQAVMSCSRLEAFERQTFPCKQDQSVLANDMDAVAGGSRSVLPEVAAVLDIQVPPPKQGRPKHGLCNTDLVSPLLERMRPPESVILGKDDFQK